MGLQPTASATGLLLGCQRPFDPDVEIDRREPGEAANYGSAFHELLASMIAGPAIMLAALAEKWGLSEYAEVAAHALAAHHTLERWLAGGNPWQEKFAVIDVEVHLATVLYLDAVATRVAEFDEDSHHYELASREIGGTYDILARSANRVVVIDAKTGDYGDFSRPSQLPQLKTLALQTGATAAAILHAPRGLPAVMYSEDISPEGGRVHLRQLRSAIRRIGDGSLRPGPHCKYCPAKESCPAKDGELLAHAAALVPVVVDTLALSTTRAGECHQMLSVFDALAKRARAEIKALVVAGEVIQRPDGRVLALREVTRESLSKSSIVRALGKQAGDREIERLRKSGCIETDTRTELHAEKE